MLNTLAKKKEKKEQQTKWLFRASTNSVKSKLFGHTFKQDERVKFMSGAINVRLSYKLSIYIYRSICECFVSDRYQLRISFSLKSHFG